MKSLASLASAVDSTLITLGRRASAFLAAASLSWSAGCHIGCNEIGCVDGATAVLSISDVALLAGGSIQACFNGTCSTGTVTELPVPGAGRVIMFDTSTLRVVLFRERPGDTGRLEVSWNFSSESLHDGDTYSVKVSDNTGADGPHLEATAKYLISSPNGDGCGPTCKFTRFTN